MREEKEESERRNSMEHITVTDSIRYVGVDDTTIDLFESQYIVPEGVSYNSYVILDDKITIMDTVDIPRFTSSRKTVEKKTTNSMEMLSDRNCPNSTERYSEKSFSEYAYRNSSSWRTVFLKLLRKEFDR